MAKLSGRTSIDAIDVTADSHLWLNNSIDGGLTFGTFKITRGEFSNLIQSLNPTLYTADGSFSGNRIVDKGPYSWTINGDASTIFNCTSGLPALQGVVTDGVGVVGIATSIGASGGQFSSTLGVGQLNSGGTDGIQSITNSASSTHFAFNANTATLLGGGAYKGKGHNRFDASTFAVPSSISFQSKSRGTTSSDIHTEWLNQAGSVGFQHYGNLTSRFFAEVGFGTNPLAGTNIFVSGMAQGAYIQGTGTAGRFQGTGGGAIGVYTQGDGFGILSEVTGNNTSYFAGIFQSNNNSGGLRVDGFTRYNKSVTAPPSNILNNWQGYGTTNTTINANFTDSAGAPIMTLGDGKLIQTFGQLNHSGLQIGNAGLSSGDVYRELLVNVNATDYVMVMKA